MRKRALFLVTTLLLFALTLAAPSAQRGRGTAAPAPAPAQAAAPTQAPEYGPAKGTLVIVGGGATEGTGIMEKFIELAGGPDAKFIIVPTAGGNMQGERAIGRTGSSRSSAGG